MDAKRQKVYKIRREDGMYSRGGTHPGFNTSGKTWYTINHLKSHLRQLAPRGLEAYKSCIVVEIEMIQREIGTRSIGMFFKDMQIKAERERQEREERERMMIEDAERKEWERLNSKYGNQE